jgi:hypothetical protein
MKIKVKNSGIVKLKFFKDFPDGNLFIAEARKNIPFKIKRVYFINGFTNEKAVRGKHAHKKLNQAIFCLNGSFDLSLDDGKRKQKIRLKDPSVGIILKPMLWHTMSGFSKDCVILVLADEWYKESDYIRDYQKFKKMLR